MKKGNLFLCFRPVVVVDERLEYCESGFGRSDHHHVLAYIKVGKEEEEEGEGVMVPAMVSSPMEDEKVRMRKAKVLLQRGGSGGDGGRGRRRSAKWIISRIANSVLFETKLTKRIRSRKVRHDPSRPVERSDHKVSDSKSVQEEDLKKIDPKVSSLSCSSFTSSSSLSSSSFSSSSSSSSMVSSWPISESNQNSNRKKPIESNRMSKTKRVPENQSSGWHLLIVSLLSLIFFGRLFAILWTATWLYLVPSCRISSSNEENRTKVTKISATESSRDHKKRIVMEGFLERNNNTRRIC